MNRNYTTNGLNQYNPVGGASYSYDLNGNLTSDGTRSYVYDNENRLVGATGGTSATLDYYACARSDGLNFTDGPVLAPVPAK